MTTGGFTKQLNNITRGLLYALVFLLPLWVLPFPMEPLELNKQTLLVGLAALATLTWLGEMVVRKHVSLRKGWVNALPALWIAAFLIPAMYSIAPYTSWFGGERQEYMSVLTAVGAALIFYLLANIHDTRVRHKHMHSVLLYSTTLVSLLAVVEVLGANILSSISVALSFNTVGTLTSLTAWLLVMNGFFLTSWIAHKKGDSLMSDGAVGGIEQLATLFVTGASVFFLLVLDDPQLWMLTVVSTLVIFILSLFKAQHLPMKGKLSLPGLLLIGSLLFWFWLPGISLDLPLEVTPNNTLSLSIAEETLQNYSSSYGSGPGTYALDYGQFKGTDLNETDFWDTRFDRASSYFFTLLPTTGFFGVTALAIFCLLLGARTLIQVVRPQSREEWLEAFNYFAPWATLVASAFLINWNMTLVGAFAMFSGLLASQVLDMESVGEVKQTQAQKLILTTGTVLLCLGVLIGLSLTIQRYGAQLAFAEAVELDRSGASMKEIVEELDRAATRNKYNDVYYRNLAEALVYRLDEVSEGVDDFSQLSIETVQYLQAITASAVNAAVRATDLSSDQPLNWSSRGFVYRELAPVLGMDTAKLSIESYKEASRLEPANPEHVVDLAKAMLLLWEFYQPLIAADTTLQAEADELLSQVMLNLEHAIELKSNYAPAHFQLALTYARAGQLDNGIGKMESVAQYNQLDVGVHFELAMLYLQRLDEGDLERAQEALEHAVTLAPTHSDAHWFLASIYEQLGDIPAAVHEVEVVLQLNPENELVMQRLEDLLTGNISTELHTTLE